MEELTAYQILDRIYYLLDSFVLIPLGFAIFRLRYLSKAEKYVFYLLAGYFLLEVISETLRWSRVRNHYISYFVTIVLYFLSIQFFNITFKIRFIKNRTLIFSLILLIPLEIIIIGFNQINSITLSMSYLLMFVLGVLCIQQIFVNKKLINYLAYSDFWFSIAFSVWGAFAFLPSLLQRYFVETSIPLYYFFDTVRMLGFAMSCIIFAIGFSKITMTNKP